MTHTQSPQKKQIDWRLTFFGRESPKRILLRYLSFACLWTPAVVVVWTYVFDPIDEFLSSLLISLVIAETAMFACYFGGYALSSAERLFYFARGHLARERSVFVDVLKGCLFMVPGLYVGFEIVGRLAPLYGFGWRTPDFGNYKRGIVVGLFNVMLFLALYLKYEADQLKKRVESEKRDLESRTLKAQIAALTAQMNPHLLFNSLNSIASMIQSAPERAEDMIVELSSLYRRVLEASKKERHSLEMELDLCRSYLEIERARFQDRIVYDIKVDNDIEPAVVDIPVLCLQPLVENAVKHGLLPRSDGGKISVRVSRVGGNLAIRIEDDGVGVGNASTMGSGTALGNCESRLRLAYGDLARLTIEPGEVGGTRVVVQLPGGRNSF